MCAGCIRSLCHLTCLCWAFFFPGPSHPPFPPCSVWVCVGGVGLEKLIRPGLAEGKGDTMLEATCAPHLSSTPACSNLLQSPVEQPSTPWNSTDDPATRVSPISEFARHSWREWPHLPLDHYVILSYYTTCDVSPSPQKKPVPFSKWETEIFTLWLVPTIPATGVDPA